jgi:hypothetical protein
MWSGLIYLHPKIKYFDNIIEHKTIRDIHRLNIIIRIIQVV